MRKLPMRKAKAAGASSRVCNVLKWPLIMRDARRFRHKTQAIRSRNHKMTFGTRLKMWPIYSTMSCLLNSLLVLIFPISLSSSLSSIHLRRALCWKKMASVKATPDTKLATNTSAPDK